MKSFRLEHPGSIDGLELCEGPSPRPGPGQALVRVRATSLNYRDLLVVRGLYARDRAPAGLVPLSDGAGEVIATGDDVTRVKVGDRVAGCFHQDWIAGRRPVDLVGDLGGGVHGLLTEETVLSEQGLVHLPAHLTFEEGAALPCAGVTAWAALTRLGPLSPGETVVTTGTGGVAIFALQLAKLFGARVVAVTRSKDKLERLRELGADETVALAETPDWDSEVRRLTDGAGADLVVDSTGDFKRTVAAVRDGGRIGVVGRRAGPPSESGFGSLIGRDVAAFGVGVGSRADFEAMNRAVAGCAMRPVIAQTFSFDAALDALRFFERGSHVGKVAITHPA